MLKVRQLKDGGGGTEPENYLILEASLLLQYHAALPDKISQKQKKILFRCITLVCTSKGKSLLLRNITHRPGCQVHVTLESKNRFPHGMAYIPLYIIHLES